MQTLLPFYNTWIYVSMEMVLISGVIDLKGSENSLLDQPVVCLTSNIVISQFAHHLDEL